MNSKILKLSFLIIALASALTACTGSIIEQSSTAASELAITGRGGIEYDEYIPPGIQFVETTSQGMNQEGFPYLKNNRVFNIKWAIKTCDPNEPATPICPAAGTSQNPDPGFYITRLYYSIDNGANWIAISGAVDLGGYNDQVQSFSWSIPPSLVSEGDQFKLKLITKNAQNNEFFATSTSFIMDNTAPVITANSLKFNGALDSPLVLQSPGVSIEFAATDSLSPIDAFCLKNVVVPPNLNSSCWVKLSSLGLSENKSIQISNLRRVLGWIGGSFSYYFWVKDRSGNISRLTNDVGDASIDYRTISYTPGKSVVFTKTLASNLDSTTENPAVAQTIINASNPTLHLKWKFTVDSSAELNSTNPYRIEFSTDGINFQILRDSTGAALTEAQIQSGIDQNCLQLSAPEANAISKCYNWTVPSNLYSVPIYIRVHVKDNNNFTYSMSTNPVNLNASIGSNGQGLGLRYVAGLSDGMIGASALSAKFNIEQGPDGGRLVVHEDGRIFVLDATFGVLVINPLDGKAQVYVKRVSTSADGIAVDSATLLAPGEKEGTTANTIRISLDYKGRLLLMETNKIRQVTDFYDSAQNLTGRREVKTIVGCIKTPCFFNNTLKNESTRNWPNAWIYSNEFDFRTPSGGTARQNRHFTPLPNGDIYFSLNVDGGFPATVAPSPVNNYRGLEFKIYRPDPDPTKPGKVYPLFLKGNGVLNEPFRPLDDLHANNIGGLTFNPVTGNPTSITMQWDSCSNNLCDFYTSNHNPKTGTSNGLGTHFFSVMQSIYAPTGIPRRSSSDYYVRYITSRRGELYAIMFSVYARTLSKLNTATNKFSIVLGSKDYDGYCPDNSLGANCPTNIRDAWITQDNTVYFIDGNQIRMLGSDGKLVTLFGRKNSDRNGSDAMLSTLSNFENFSKWKPAASTAERIIIKEQQTHILREFPIQGNIDTIAGNETTFWNLSWKNAATKPGYVSSNLESTKMGFWNGSRYATPPVITHPTSGEVFVNTPDTLSFAKLNRSLDSTSADYKRWIRILGGGAASAPHVGTKGAGAASCDGKMNTQCKTDWNGSIHPYGFIPEKQLTPDSFGNPRTRPAQLISIINRSGSVWEKYYMKLVNPDTGLQTHFVGNDNTLPVGTAANFFPDTYSMFDIAHTNKVPWADYILSPTYDSQRDALIVAMHGYNTVGVIDFKIDPTTENITEANKYYNLTKTDLPIIAFTHVTIQGTDVIYYCANNNRLFKRVITPTSAREYPILLPPGVLCLRSRNFEKTIDDSAGVLKLYIPILFNGQYMVGEYNEPLQL